MYQYFKRKKHRYENFKNVLPEIIKEKNLNLDKSCTEEENHKNESENNIVIINILI